MYLEYPSKGKENKFCLVMFSLIKDYVNALLYITLVLKQRGEHELK